VLISQKRGQNPFVQYIWALYLQELVAIVTSLGNSFFGNTFSTVPSLPSLKQQNNGGLKVVGNEK
jgi:hypothetical protein